ncbi:CopM family metallochaperone [Yoonia sp.]|uniref:CopM family metallochaperone n=1 Tax=Yoonia sp. TaxID=2212373 RepID=UPI002DF9D987|nr:DUF305 domain-containing protein [Yoonia sp.]
MNLLKTAVAAAAISYPAFAQDAAFQLPEQCITSTEMDAMDHGAMNHGAMGHSVGNGVEMMGSDSVDFSTFPEHVQENMRKMMITMPAMEQGMMNQDPDVAFACGMIAHHQGAIDMAQVLLDHGDDPEMIKLAEEIMQAQVGEIEQMTNWLAANVE